MIVNRQKERPMPPAPLAAPDTPVRTKGCCQPLADPLPERRAAELSSVFRALADPTRVRMVHLLAEAPVPICVCDFTATFPLGQPTISHHLAKLREVGIVTSFRRGLWTFHSLASEMPASARAAVTLIRAGEP
jgi:ArsR family transcriptional regulator